MFVFFDIGSTLVDGPSRGPGRRLVELLGLPEGARASLDDFLFRTPLEGPRALAGYLVSQCNVEPDSAIHISDSLWQSQIREARIVPGAREVLQQLRGAGIPYGFISNIWVPFYQGFQALLQEEIRDRPRFLSFELGLAKPGAAIYEAALSALSLSPGQTIMVGDTYANDIAPAMATGMKTIWLLHRPEKERRDLVKVLNGQLPSPDRTVAALQDLEPDIFYPLPISR
uniref:Haloacid dehalogenase superfamily, subfamily IA, variant 3 with third motif having DD or ED/haloacid dehalogenase superfamily, subfamily IA, variant 1 with third motif having Dx(3-4)D or Dx(3-4)E n=1 Tax=Candidatus Kentrum sp. FM TaxID=2126340 RepID=A0A450SC11_9GAMM|nr:MAG: haloacid dehalogenase superfamily, subfamily IA, variant 3 with third motif having DD or ED/haloacid dehalogenase superfamily, subfamily IA, variant 1 with third motif having Dx(3-4)D or Dx(3-4)E [Candidatus Kentron sp. FM]VFJ49860.1 MAG: haloacid dehalogenase superfamily, subfamily IA, variant 3 with third motif having DD or ED/haloacid dehalogenase superfamily, subfamily IA, variant 1 with third motif having Dx(3-4)D or Dx(3-4)E [Candidatus Kentron sp. FM]VFK10994.1 MAG: haloacid dehalo